MKLKSLTLVALVLATTSVHYTAAAEPTLKNESEAGLVITTGNTDIKTITAKHSTTYVFDENTLKFNARFLKSSTFSIESARFWTLGLRYERAFTDVLSGFVAQGIESDKFSGYLQKYNTDIGMKYILANNAEELKWFVEGGYRYTAQNNINGSKPRSHYARLYTEVEKPFNKDVTAKFWAEYLPNFTTSEDWQANGELSLTAVMSSVFSVKMGYLAKFDNLPVAGLKKVDSIATAALVAKY